MLPTLSVILLPPLLIPLAINGLTLLISHKPQPSNENASPFECGFDPHSNSRSPFSLQFFLLAVLFLVFDVEIALIMALPLLMATNHPALLALPLSLFLAILILGLYHEWNEGSISWNQYN